MRAKRLPYSIRKHIRKEKAQIRRRFFTDNAERQAALVKLLAAYRKAPAEKITSLRQAMQEAQSAPPKKEGKSSARKVSAAYAQKSISKMSAKRTIKK